MLSNPIFLSMQYLRESLLTICICLYGFLAVVLGLNYWLGHTSEAATVGTYRPDLALELSEAEDFAAPWLDALLEVKPLGPVPNVSP